MSKFQLQCSCIICRQTITAQSLRAHHTKHFQLSACVHCFVRFEQKGTKRFCSHSCSAQHNNRGRIRSIASKLKSSASSQRLGAYCKFGYCIICDRQVQNSHNQTCSSKCKGLAISAANRIHISTIRLNRGRHKRSYLEQSFENWLIQNQYSNYQTEVKFYNPIIKRSYFVDFLFEDKKLIIELDGTQHLNTVEKDAARDKFLVSLGYKVVRITHLEYKNMTKLSLIKSLLNISSVCETLGNYRPT